MRVSEDVKQASRQAARGEAKSPQNTERSAALTETFTRGLAKLRSLRSSSGTVQAASSRWGDTQTGWIRSRKRGDSTGLTPGLILAQIASGAAGYLGINTLVAGAELQVCPPEELHVRSIGCPAEGASTALPQEQIRSSSSFGDRRVEGFEPHHQLPGPRTPRGARTCRVAARQAPSVFEPSGPTPLSPERTGPAERLSLARGPREKSLSD